MQWVKILLGLLYIVKLTLPHVGLLTLLLGYIASGAAVFQAIELPEEMAAIDEKMKILRQLYELVTNASRIECHNNYEMYNVWMTDALKQISIAHNSKYAIVDPKELFADAIGKSSPRWSYSAAILYALGVVTTTGYSYVQVSTTFGKMFAVVYGLLGFPLVFLTAADIGTLLSGIINSIYNVYWVKKERSRRSSAGLVNLDAAAKDVELVTVQLPVWAILGTVLAICMLGSFLYMRIEGWNFVNSLYFAFNSVASITTGDAPASGPFFAITSTLYVILGLSVVTMSIDLARNQLRNVFHRIHYFGRQIKNLRGIFTDEDMRDMLRVIIAIRRRYPKQGKITEADIVEFLKEKLDQTAFIPQAIGSFRFVDDDRERSMFFNIQNSRDITSTSLADQQGFASFSSAISSS